MKTNTNNTACAWSRMLLLGVCAFMTNGILSPLRAASLPEQSLDAATLAEFSATSGDELLMLCAKNNWACGIEEQSCFHLSSLRNTLNPTTVHLKSVTPRQVLNHIARLYPGYRWKIRNGVVNLEPNNRTGSDLLSIRLSTVSIHGEISRVAFRKILQLAGIGVVNGFEQRQPQLYGVVDVELHDTTVRDALNAIARADGQVAWECGPYAAANSAACFSDTTWRTSGGRLQNDATGNK